MLRKPFSMIFLTCFLGFLSFSSTGCSLNRSIQKSDLSSVTDEDPSDTPSITENSLTLSPTEFTGISYNQVTFSVPFSGDGNNNATVNIYFCSIKLQAGCKPENSEMATLTKSSSSFYITLDLSTTSVTPGDFLKYKLVSTDPDGLVGGQDTGFIFIPQGGSNPVGITQFNQFLLGHNNSNTLSFTGSDYLFTMLIDENNNIFLAGYTSSSVSEPNGGSIDAFIVKIKENGEIDTTFAINGVLQLGGLISSVDAGTSLDEIIAMASDGGGNIFVAGQTGNSLGGTNAGGYDGFIAKLSATSGLLDPNFGDGDGSDDDGIVQLNATNTANAGNDDKISAISIDGNGNLFVTGYTMSSLGGANAGNNDVFIAKLSATSGLLDPNFGDGDGSDDDGIVQLNATNTADAGGHDYALSMTLDENNNVFMAGYTYSSLGGTNAGIIDCFIAKLSATSGLLDSAFGDGDGSDDDGIVQLNATNTANAGSSESISAIALDGSGNIFVTGFTSSALGGANAGNDDGFIAKLSATSGLLDPAFGDGDGSDDDGIVQLNATNTANAGSSESISAIALDGSGNVFVTGYTGSALGGANAGNDDGFIAKLSATSGLLDPAFGDGDGSDDDGIVQLNATNAMNAGNDERIHAMALDGSGNVFVTGYTTGSLGGTNAGSSDGIITKLNATSGLLDTNFSDGDGSDNDGIFQLNTINTAYAGYGDIISAMVLDGSGNVFVTGYTGGGLGGANAGSNDGFIVKLSATSGLLDPAFGDGDGSDDDGIVQLNATNTANAGNDDKILTMVLDGSGNLYVSGLTNSSLGGVNAGNYDGFIAKLSATSGLLDPAFGDGDGSDDDGIVQLNATNTANAGNDEVISAIALDGIGNIFVTGHTASSLGGANAGASDGFIAKLSTTSGLLDPNFGDGDGSDDDGIVQLNATNTSSAINTEQISAIALDGIGNIFVTGYTDSSLGGANAGASDGFIAKLSTTSGLLDPNFGDGDGSDDDGIVQLNATNTSSAIGAEFINAMTSDASGNVFVAGYTTGSLGGTNAGSNDGFIAKLNDTSGLLDPAFGDGDGSDDDGIVQLNASNTADASFSEAFTAIALDGSGNIFVTGYTLSSLSGVKAGSDDGFIAKLNATSGLLDPAFGDGDGSDDDGIVQLNATNTSSAADGDYTNAIALDGSGNVFVSGYTVNSLGGANAGSFDGFLLRCDSTTGVIP
ncbi:MAG: hypothetical protein H6625_00310 [Bdellovibrionaceae bacterium]|nr:hypothetical protein [Pseudobdellovibrionaceae bacterium]